MEPMRPDLPGHLSSATSHPRPLSLSPPLHLSRSLARSASFPLTISPITPVWRSRRGLSLNVKPGRANGGLSRSGHRENKVRERHVGGERGKKAESTPLHTALAPILSVPSTSNRIAERTSRSRKKHDGERQTVILSVPRLSHSGHA